MSKLSALKWDNGAATTPLHHYKVAGDGDKFVVEKIRRETQKKEVVTGFDSEQDAMDWCYNNHYLLKMQPYTEPSNAVFELKVIDKRVGKDVDYPLPTQATDGSAGIDLRACIDNPIVIEAGKTVLVGTGIAIHIKDDSYMGMVLPRSGLGSKSGIVLGNLVGVIDSDYQGELMMCLWNRSDTDYTLQPATRVAQYIVVPIVKPAFKIVEEFGETSGRSVGGFGSTGDK